MTAPTEGSIPRRLLPWRAWRAAWARREAFGGEGILLTALIVMGGVAATYAVVSRVCNWREHVAFDPTMGVDALIPAVPWTILLYGLHFVFFPLAALAAPRSDAGRLSLLALVQAQVVLVLGSCALFLLFPARIHLVGEMHAVLPDQPGWIRALYGALYSFDEPWNAWPSLHVSQSLLNVVFLIRAMGDVPGRRWWLPRGAARGVLAAVLWALWVGLDVSILTTRQHFVFDLLTGLAAGVGVLWGVLLPSLRALDRRGPAALTAEAFAPDQGYQESPT